MWTSPNRVVGLIVGALYVALGLVGFTATVGVGFFDYRGGLLLGVLEVNPFHNLLHIVIGAGLAIAALSTIRASQTVNSVVGAICLVFGLAGLFLVGTTINIMAINVADNVLHFASAALLLAVGLGAEKRQAPATV
jgi:hypothetical protein